MWQSSQTNVTSKFALIVGLLEFKGRDRVPLSIHDWKHIFRGTRPGFDIIIIKFVQNLHLLHLKCVNKVKKRPHVQCKHSDFRGFIFGYDTEDSPAEMSKWPNSGHFPYGTFSKILSNHRNCITNLNKFAFFWVALIEAIVTH